MSFPETKLTVPELAEACGLTIMRIHQLLQTHNITSNLTLNKRRVVPVSGARQLLETRGFIYPQLNLSFQIVKGGTGKTSLSSSFAVRASHYGARVLVIDLDQQANMTQSLGINATNIPVWVDFIRKECAVEDAIIKIKDNLDLIPSSLANCRLEVELMQSTSNIRDLLKDTIAPIRHRYDIVVIDCAPAITITNTAVSCASDLVVLPVNPDGYSLHGLDLSIRELKRLQTAFKITNDYRIAWNKFDGRTRLSPHFMYQLELQDEYVIKTLSSVCRIDAGVNNAIESGSSIFELPKKSYMRSDVDALTRELIGLTRWKEENMKDN